MARFARVVSEGMPHHVVQRGNRRQKVFFSSEDKQEYLRLFKESVRHYDVKVWSYCLMDNHVHFILVPSKAKNLADCVGWLNRQYTRMIHFREGWRGYLWQGRFSSFVLDDKYTYAAVRYVERNPVRAKIVENAEDYEWSSARARVEGKKDELLNDFYLIDEIKDWRKYLAEEGCHEDLNLFRKHGSTGRPLGSKDFIERLSRELGINLIPKKPGPRKKE